MATFVDKLKTDYDNGNFTVQSVKAQDWFVSTMAKVQVTPAVIYKSSVQVSTITYGKMYMYFYDPKGKDTLPYYDIFPLVLPMEPREGGFLGINFHYVDPYVRAMMLDYLRENNYSDLLVIYNRIKYDPIAKFCLKQYLFGQVKSKFIEIEPYDFEWVMYLPTERFQKSSKTSVWAQARKKF